MSDTPQGPGWWQASDGSWSPPASHPDPVHRAQHDDPAAAKPPWWRRRWVIVAGVVLVLLAVAGAISGGEDGATDTADGSPTTSTTADSGTTTSEDPAPTTTEATATTAESTTTTTSSTTTTTTTAPPAEPIVYTGSGSQVVQVDVPDDYLAAAISHQGRSNFAVVSYDTAGNRLDLIVNEIGDHLGTHLVPERPGALEVTADGTWNITFLPPELLRRATEPTIGGRGPDVVVVSDLDLSGLVTGTFRHSGESNFAVIGWSDDDRNLLVNEIGVYEGQAVVSADTILFEVQADGDWVIQLG
jgi:hypothetical protein